MKTETFIALSVIFLLFSGSSLPEEIKVPYVVEDACPFEGCTFGDWQVLSETRVFEKPDRSTAIVGTLEPGTKASVITGIEFISPGRARIIGKPYSHGELIDRSKEILVLNYVGEGWSQVFHNDHFFTTKITRDRSECSDQPNWRNCWVELLKEPVSSWWVRVESIGWVPMDIESLEPIDAFS